jgi:hydroxyacylglutathione hydrolase
MKSLIPILFYFLILSPFTNSQNYKIFSERSGFLNTNSYLVFDTITKEAAIIDPAGPQDTLLQHVKLNDLTLKYIMLTHAHPDHLTGVPSIRKFFPDAKLIMSIQEYEDMQIYSDWENRFSAEMIEKIRSSPAALEMFNFDVSSIGETDLFLNGEDTLYLGDIMITTILSPGHSRGSICYLMQDVLFSGDVLMYRRVGNTNLPDSGSPEEMIKSVRRLYSILDDNTVVYPGHGRFTDIGSEKVYNTEVTVDSADLKD